MSETEKQRAEMLRRLRKLADRKVNDAVKLAFLTPETADQVERLDLSGLVELKRSEKSFEAKFVDQLRVLELMRELMERGDPSGAEEFFQALGQRAGTEDG